MSDFGAELLEFVCDLADDETLNQESSLFESQRLDSLSLSELIGFIEERSGIKVAPLDIGYENFDSVAKILVFVTAKRTTDA